MSTCENKDKQTKLIDSFTNWLKENGAVYSKIEFPSNDTESGVRGAVAIEDIESNEVMLQIPIHLMMCPPVIFQDQDIGDLLRKNHDLLHGDLLLAVYIMHEMLKKESSFYFPYLQILPAPFNISEWSTEELKNLQVFHHLSHVYFFY